MEGKCHTAGWRRIKKSPCVTPGELNCTFVAQPTRKRSHKKLPCRSRPLVVQEKSPAKNTLSNRITERCQLRLTVRAAEVCPASCEHNGLLALRMKPTDDRRHTRGMPHVAASIVRCTADWRGSETRPCSRSATAVRSTSVRLGGALGRLQHQHNRPSI